jgi:hypothetical protein
MIDIPMGRVLPYVAASLPSLCFQLKFEGGAEMSAFTRAEFILGRCMVSVLYVMGLLQVATTPGSGAISVLAVTAAYAILMMLLWVHERYPPRP